MKIVLSFAVVLALTNRCLNAPLHEHQTVEDDPELTAGYFEGDMMMVLEELNGLRNESLRWPNNTVYYRFGDQFDEPHQAHILRGMRIIEEVSCIRFRLAQPEQEYFINITAISKGCYSNVGWLRRVQSFNLQIYPLDEGCFRLGTIVHELLHTLGFQHMQSTHNRDDYVRIVEENIKPDKMNNFKKYDDKRVDNFGETYDYGSVLHYSAYAFSANGEQTIIPLLQEEAAGVMGQRRGLSKGDINKLNIMYRCPIGV